MDTIIKAYYDKQMPETLVPRLTVRDFSRCGSLGDKFGKGTAVVLFYVPESRFSQEFSSELANFAVDYAPKLDTRTFAVNMSDGDNNRLIRMSSNFSYSLGKVWPTIIVFYNGNPCSSYSGPRTSQGLEEFISRTVTSSTSSCEFKFVPCD
jgi:thioredoxin-like negative regulator of GroEL